MAQTGGGHELLAGEYEPSPIDRIRNQVALYESSGGAEGNTLEDRPVVILTTVGAKSLKVRKNPVIRIVRDGTYAAVASAAGASKNPSWYDNLVAHPLVRVQDGTESHEYRAREVSGTEKDAWWAVAESFWPYFPAYRQKAGAREIPVIVFEPVAH